MQSVTPATMSATPTAVSRGRIFSPSAAPATAVTAKVVALVTGTASVIGLSLSLMTNRTDMERLRRNGSEYCHTHSSRIQSPRKLPTTPPGPLCFPCSTAARVASSAISVPHFMSAFVIPHTVPIASSHPTIAIAPDCRPHAHQASQTSTCPGFAIPDREMDVMTVSHRYQTKYQRVINQVVEVANLGTLWVSGIWRSQHKGLRHLARASQDVTFQGQEAQGV